MGRGSVDLSSSAMGSAIQKTAYTSHSVTAHPLAILWRARRTPGLPMSSAWCRVTTKSEPSQ